ncbi:hypothetical protein, partial [Pseudomonas gingeri]|uniref:hypothetical protein n=1 Tax=Pseudomonas gingeri TaxID=117681 RepID=UPI001C434B74
LWDRAFMLADKYARYFSAPFSQAAAQIVDLLSVARQFGYAVAGHQERWLREYLRQGEFWLVPHVNALLKASDIPLAQRLRALEAQPQPGAKS